MAGTQNAVGYFRVSTQAQGRSGLGLEAQQRIVREFCAARGLKIVAEHVEIESGRNADRPKLARALAEADLRRATVVVAKLDRLSRDTVLLKTIERSGVNVAFADLPQVPAGATGRFILGIMGEVAQLEAGLISQRTRDALRAARERGVTLGRPENLTAEARARGRAIGAPMGNAAKIEKARKRALALAPMIEAARQSGATSLRQIARALDAQNVETSRGSQWTAAAVARVLAYLEPAPAA